MLIVANSWIGLKVDGMVEIVKTGVIEAIQECALRFIKWMGIGLLGSSYWICLIIAMTSLLLYIAGNKKAGKYVTLSMIIFFILQCLKVAFL